MLNQLATNELTAETKKRRSCWTTRRRCCESTLPMRLPNGNSIQSTIWADREGDVHKTRVDVLRHGDVSDDQGAGHGGLGNCATRLGTGRPSCPWISR